jgi:hypothetical protein
MLTSTVALRDHPKLGWVPTIALLQVATIVRLQVALTFAKELQPTDSFFHAPFSDPAYSPIKVTHSFPPRLDSQRSPTLTNLLDVF